MSDSTKTEVDVNTDDLDDFNKLLTGAAVQKTEVEIVEEVEDEDIEDAEEDPLETDDETDEGAAEEEAEDEDPEPEPKPEQKKKSRFQIRIDELTAKQLETDRQLREALAKLNKPDDKEVKPAPKPTASEETAPSPDDLSETGEAKYPLGEFDPLYIRELTRFTIRQETNAAKLEAQEEARARQLEEARTALTSEWSTKLEKARTVYPDLDEKNSVLESTFVNLEPQYGEYLASTIMSMEYGPDVLYYLANNIEEAKRIAASGPTKATVALGRLEARFADHEDTVEQKQTKVSKAPSPPPAATRGTGTKSSVPDDTDDLEAFEKKFFAKR